jgi:mono/diheme cytochrome c family protein
MLKPKLVLTKWAFLIAAIGLLSACSDVENTATSTTTTVSTTSATEASARWYTSEQLAQGKVIFSENCAACHGADAGGVGASVGDWKTPDANGLYPAPPINGSAHAWHHSLKTLLRTINDGGKPLGGTMPAWQGRLTDAEQLSVVAAFQDYWPDDIYAKWRVIDLR